MVDVGVFVESFFFIFVLDNCVCSVLILREIVGVLIFDGWVIRFKFNLCKKKVKMNEINCFM